MNADQILRLRERLRLSQEDFARRLNVTRRTVGRWERGESVPSPVFIKLMQEMH